MIPGVRSVLCSSASDLSMKYNLASERFFTFNNKSHLARPPCFLVKCVVVG